MIEHYKAYIETLESKVIACEKAYEATGIEDFLDTQTELLTAILDLRESIKEMEDETADDHNGEESSTM